MDDDLNDAAPASADETFDDDEKGGSQDDEPDGEGGDEDEEDDNSLEDEDWAEWEFQELGPPTETDPTGSWFGSVEEICEEIAIWAGCLRVWGQVSGRGDEILERCASCSVETRMYDSGYPGGSGYDYMVRTKDGPAFRKEFRREVLLAYR